MLSKIKMVRRLMTKVKIKISLKMLTKLVTKAKVIKAKVIKINKVMLTQELLAKVNVNLLAMLGKPLNNHADLSRNARSYP